LADNEFFFLGEVLSLAIFGKNYVAAGYKNSSIKIFDLEMKAMVHEIPRAHTSMNSLGEIF